MQMYIYLYAFRVCQYKKVKKNSKEYALHSFFLNKKSLFTKLNLTKNSLLTGNTKKRNVTDTFIKHRNKGKNRVIILKVSLLPSAESLNKT